jgi:predicted glycoside hydrolase/deacetylase ChbG (UPF0249 family)
MQSDRETKRKHGARVMMAALTAAAMVVGAAPATFAEELPPELLIRVDDIGMNHSVNTALRQFIAVGIPFSASVMVPCPWFPEAAEILRHAPQVSVGIHLTLNSEWKDYRWGPVLGASAVPSLVDADGRFFPTAEALAANGPDSGEVRRELRAQIERALAAGLDPDYLDYHMLTAVSNPEMRVVVEALAAEFGLGLSRYFGEPSMTLWDVEPALKLPTVLDMLETMGTQQPNLLVIHLGLETPEMNALVDANNPDDPYRVARHRQAELDVLTAPAFLRSTAARGIRFVTYSDMVARYGLEAMAPPAAFGYSMDQAPEP